MPAAAVEFPTQVFLRATPTHGVLWLIHSQKIGTLYQAGTGPVPAQSDSVGGPFQIENHPESHPSSLARIQPSLSLRREEHLKFLDLAW
jgi:hypothetical protein